MPAYAEGTRLAPEALQCGDRWYLYKNLCDAATRPSAPTARTCASRPSGPGHGEAAPPRETPISEQTRRRHADIKRRPFCEASSASASSAACLSPRTL